MNTVYSLRIFIWILQTRKRGNSQRDGRLSCMPKILWQNAKILVNHGNKGRLGANLNDTIKLVDPEKITLEQESGTCLLWTPNDSQFCVQIAKFSSSWQQGSVGGKLERDQNQNLQCGTRIWDISPIHVELLPILCWNA